MATATPEKEVAEKSKKRVQSSKVNVGDLMAFIYYTQVDDVRKGGDELTVTDVDRQDSFRVQGKPLVESSYSADQFHTTKRATKTKVAETLVGAFNRPFSVCFEKTDGTERTLRGRLIKPEPLLGRSMVEDLDIVSGHRMRQVDHRTIRWLIVDGIKYTVRK